MKALNFLMYFSSIFEIVGIEDSVIEAENIILHAFNLSKISLYRDNPKIKKEFKNISKKLLKNRLKRIPLQYIIGYTQFYGLKIKTPLGVFIPRPETELLVEEIIKLIHTENIVNPYILDIGTGTGCIALSIAKHISSAKVFGVDISDKAIKTAKINAKLNNIKNVCFLKGNVFSPFKSEKFKFIVSNPPYIKHKDIEFLAPEIKIYEPREAIDGGSDGLDFYRKILNQASVYLYKGGYIIFEIGIGETEDIINIAIKEGFNLIKKLKDTSGIDRVITFKKG